MTWPQQFGGRRASNFERYVVVEEMLAFGAPCGAHWIADRQSGPLILRHGTEPARRSILPRIAAGECEIGCRYNFAWRGKVGAYLSGFSYEDDSKLKPGLVSHYLAIEHHLKGDARVYDLLAGDMQYKRSLAMESPPMYWADLQRPRLKLRLEDWLRDTKNRFARAGTKEDD